MHKFAWKRQQGHHLYIKNGTLVPLLSPMGCGGLAALASPSSGAVVVFVAAEGDGAASSAAHTTSLLNLPLPFLKGKATQFLELELEVEAKLDGSRNPDAAQAMLLVAMIILYFLLNMIILYFLSYSAYAIPLTSEMIKLSFFFFFHFFFWKNIRAYQN